MGKFAIKPWLKLLSWLVAAIIVVLNVKLVFEELQVWISTASHPWMIEALVLPIVIALIIILFYLTVIPLIKQAKSKEAGYIHPPIATSKEFSKPLYQKILVALDFSKTDNGVVQHALSLAQKNSEYLFIHVVESAAALVFGDETEDFESISDEQRLENYAAFMREQGFQVQSKVGYGNPKILIPKMAEEFEAQLLVMGAHGHGWFKDIVFGTTIESVRHKVKIPVLIVRNN
jgi:manganese transport protein